MFVTLSRWAHLSFAILVMQYLMPVTAQGSDCSGEIFVLNATCYPQRLGYTIPPDNQNKAICNLWIFQVSMGLRVHFDDLNIECDTPRNAFFEGVHPAVESFVNLCDVSAREFITILPGAFMSFFGSMVGSGFSLTYEEIGIPCQSGTMKLIATEIPQPLHSFNYPGNYPNQLDCLWRIEAPSGFVKITFADYAIPDLESGDCPNDRVSIYNGEEEDSGNLLRVICGNSNTRLEEFTTSTSVALIRFQTNRDTVGKGFNLTFVQVNEDDPVGHPGCPSEPLILEAKPHPDVGVIKSPNYPFEYENGHNCNWILKATSGFVKMVFVEYFLEGVRGGQCPNDHISIYDGEQASGTLLVKTCGILPPGLTEEYFSNSSTALINFQTNERVVRRGFQIFFYQVDVRTTPTLEELLACPVRRFELQASTSPQVFTSINYPGDYFNFLDCKWRIAASSGSVTISVNYTIEHDRDCSRDFLAIYKVENDETTLVDKLCGSSSKVFIIASPVVDIDFQSDDGVADKGFRLIHQLTANGTQSDPPTMK